MTRSSGWLIRHRTAQPPRLRLFCLPYAGGGAQIFRDYPRLLPGDVEVCVAQLPGREKRFVEPALDRVDALADALAPVVSAESSLPYAIFGHSLGALVGFEVARRILAAGGAMPRSLMVSAHRAPHLPDPDPPIHHLPDAEFVNELRELNGTPQEVFDSPELLELILPMLKADFAAAETYTYRPGPALPCPITVLGGTDDSLIPVDNLNPWKEHTSAGMALHVIEGDHFFIHSRQQEVMDIIGKEIHRVRTSSGEAA